MARLNVLVTGGAGFIGSHLTDALVECGHRLRVLDLLVPQVHGNGAAQYLNPEAEFIHGDVCDPQTVERALDGVEAVFHQAAEVGVGQSMYEIDRYVRANDLGTGTLLQRLIGFKDRIRKLVVASSMSIYGEGAYSCATCGAVYPQLRPLEQLLDRRWEMECADRSWRRRQRAKTNPCFQLPFTRSQNKIRSSSVSWWDALTEFRLWPSVILMCTARGRPSRIHTPVCARFFPPDC